MSNFISRPLENETSMWLQNLVCGHSGLVVKVKQSVFCGSSPFQKVELFDTYRFGLTLCLGGTIVLTERDYEPYHEMMVHPAMISHPAPKRVCVIGGGDGGCLREVLKYPSVEKVVIVEIDSLVKETVERYMPYFAAGFSDPRVEAVINDGYEYIKDIDNVFDIILVDSYDPGGPVRSLETADFFVRAAAAAGEEGIVVLQTDSPAVRPDMIRQTITRASAVFGHYRPYICALRPFPEGICSFLMAGSSKKSIDGFDGERYRLVADACAYYNAEVHMGAFLLPQGVKNIVNG
jgi:spermidine synthase